MVGAFLGGLFSDKPERGNRSIFDVEPSCPTGHCTFPQFQTLAVCSKCEDITRYIIWECFQYVPFEDRSDEGVALLHSLGHNDLQGNVNISSGIYCEYSSPNGSRLNKTFDDDTSGGMAMSASLSAVSDAPPVHTITNFTSIPTRASTDQGPMCESDSTATECFLYWCVNTLDVAVRNGHLSETLNNSWHSDEFDHWYPDIQEHDSEGSSGVPLAEMWLVRGDLSPPTPDLHGKVSNFTITRQASVALSILLDRKLEVSTSLTVNVVEVQSYPTDHQQSSIETLRLFLGRDLHLVFQTLAESMTRNVRNTALDLQRHGLNASEFNVSGVDLVHGTATAIVVYVSVRWGWLAFPITRLLMSLSFLSLVVWQPAHKRLKIWKTSPLPLLFNQINLHQTDAESKEREGKDKISDMEKVAKNYQVMLKDGTQGMRLAN